MSSFSFSRLTLGAILAGVFAPTFVFAEISAQSTGLTLAGTTSGLASVCTSGASNCFVQIVGSLINTVLGLVGIILLAFLIYAGVLWMTAGGETKQVQTAKDMIKNVFIGLVLVIASVAISTFVVDQLISATGGGSSTGTTKTPVVCAPNQGPCPQGSVPPQTFPGA